MTRCARDRRVFFVEEPEGCELTDGSVGDAVDAVTIMANATAEVHFLGQSGTRALTLSAKLVSAQNHPTVTVV
jgi:hypothetical protein